MCRSRFPRRPPNVGGGLDAPRALLPALLAVAPVMWASQDAKLPRTDAESGPMALGSLCSVATGCRASRSVKRSDGHCDSPDGCSREVRRSGNRDRGGPSSSSPIAVFRGLVLGEADGLEHASFGHGHGKHWGVYLKPWRVPPASLTRISFVCRLTAANTSWSMARSV